MSEMKRIEWFSYQGIIYARIDGEWFHKSTKLVISNYGHAYNFDVEEVLKPVEYAAFLIDAYEQMKAQSNED